MAVSNAVIGAVMGFVLLLIAGSVNVIRAWRRESPEAEAPGRSFAQVLDDPATWNVVFIVIALAFGVGAVVFVGGIDIPAVGQETVGQVLVVSFGILLGLFFLAGLYSSVRARGVESAPAIGVLSAILGLLVLVAILAKLVLG